MPCRYYTEAEELKMAYDSNKKVREEFDKLSRLLCYASQILEDNWQYLQYVGGSDDPLHIELMEWWKQHQKDDAKYG